VDQRTASLVEAFSLPPRPDSDDAAGLLDHGEIARLRELLEARPEHANAPMLIGSAAAAAILGLAVLAALRDLNEWLIYGLAAGAVAALVLGMRGATAAARRREREALSTLLQLPVWVLARATVSNELRESTRVRIVNILNANYPGWTVDIDSADPAWRDLKNATGRPGGSCGGCGSGCR
jgi:hypothetical protein